MITVPTILVVEDETLIRLVVADMLQDKGFKVIEATNADEAILIIEKAAYEIDLIFTDVRMPGGIDGIGLVKWVRRIRPDVPIIVASGDIGPDNRDEILPLADAFLPKPYALELAEAKIREAIALRKSQARNAI